MKLTVKLVVVFVLGIMLLIAANGYLRIQRETRAFEDDATADARRVGSVMEPMVATMWRERGQQPALEMIRKTSGPQYAMRIRWVWFDAAADDPHKPKAPREHLAAVTIDKTVVFRLPEENGAEFIHAYWPVQVHPERRGGLELSKPTTQLEEMKSDVILRTGGMMLATTLLTIVLATAVGVGFVGRPLKRLTEKTRRVAAGDLTGPVQLNTHDELAELADGLNTMCDRLSASQQQVEQETANRVAAMEQLRHADRLRTVGRLASGVAHELGTPLNVISGRAALIASDKLDDQQRTESAKTIKSEADRMAGTIRQLLDFARCNAPRKASVDLTHVIEQTIELLSPIADKRKVHVAFEPSEQGDLSMVDVGQIQQVLTNLIVNAMHASAERSDVAITLSRAEAHPPEDHEGSAGVYDCIVVQDHGVGIDPENIEHLFEPFFTTKDIGEGTGLGLSIAYGIVQEHSGWIDVASEVGHGSTFSVYLPVETTS